MVVFMPIFDRSFLTSCAIAIEVGLVAAYITTLQCFGRSERAFETFGRPVG